MGCRLLLNIEGTYIELNDVLPIPHLWFHAWISGYKLKNKQYGRERQRGVTHHEVHTMRWSENRICPFRFLLLKVWLCRLTNGIVRRPGKKFSKTVVHAKAMNLCRIRVWKSGNHTSKSGLTFLIHMRNISFVEFTYDNFDVTTREYRSKWQNLVKVSTWQGQTARESSTTTVDRYSGPMAWNWSPHS